jgi:succinate dehydrogenase / fumarate reductase cytochrome b subunit
VRNTGIAIGTGWVPEETTSMARLRRLAGSSIGSKAIVAVTGAMLFLFLIVHLVGNLQVYAGSETFNAYAGWYKDHPAFLWTARTGLLVIFLVHLYFTVRLWIGNRIARPERYRCDATVQATWASRYMIYTGAVVLAFAVFHILHFTAHVVDTGKMAVDATTGHIDAHGMVLAGFSLPWVSIVYIVAQALLGLHLWHGIQSLFQTLGARHTTINPAIRFLTPAITLLLVAGNILIPISVLAGWVS